MKIIKSNLTNKLGPTVIQLYSCSTQLSMEFQLPIKAKMMKMKKFLAFKPSDGVAIILIHFMRS